MIFGLLTILEKMSDPIKYVLKKYKNDNLKKYYILSIKLKV